jgi:hypothetical protein
MTGEDFSALRFQLAYMSYALALAHVHRLPAAPGVFRKPFDQLIEKMMRPDCWIYWNFVSRGEGMHNKYLGPLPEQWDPVAKDNIMYSAYLQSMALLYHYLFQSDKYAKPGALTLELKTAFWREGGFTFEYDERSLNDLIYWQMANEGFLGVACEPDCVFQICNQPNILGFKLHDMIYGGDLADQATTGYLKAWSEFGLMSDTGNFTTFVQANKRSPVTVPMAGMDYWLMTLLHAWHPSIVREQYPALLSSQLREGPNGSRWILPAMHAADWPGEVVEEAASTAFEQGWGACVAAEVGDTETVDAMLAYADHFNGVWEGGAYYHRRNDNVFNDEGYFVGMDAMTGNALLTYARLNVKDGLKKLYEGALDDRHFKQPALVDLPGDVDVRRAWFDDKRQALVITLGAASTKRPIRLQVSLPEGRPLPVVIRDGETLRSGVQRSDEGLSVDIDHAGRTDLVFQW